ncbi:MAG TPA: tripartite tricarboxylate transporter permease [Steroidobacteraceae bacterium]
MEILGDLGTGLALALTWQNLAYCFVGVVLGTMIGVLPGIGPVTTIAMLLPVTFGLPTLPALIMLAGIYYGAQYGGSTSAILINLPGEVSSAVTAIDGYRLARMGRAGVALGIAAIASFVGGCVGTLAIAAFAPVLSSVALSFGPAEYFSLAVLGLVTAMVLASDSLLRGTGMILLGLLLSTVGTDITDGTERYTFGVLELSDGISFVIVAVGLFGVAEILVNLQQDSQVVAPSQVRGVIPPKEDLRTASGAIARGTLVGTLLGVLPGAGSLLSSFGAYALEKRLAREPQRFGAGAIEGVAAPEAANNACAQTSFIPLLTLGIPSNAVMALMIGALTIHGVAAGPTLLTERPDLFWGVVASMLAGNVLLLVLNLPLIGLWVSLLRVRYRMLYPAILLFSMLGVYSLASSTFDVLLAAGFGLFGWILLKLGCSPVPLLLGFILGPFTEENLRRAMLLSRGDPMTFLTRPLSGSILFIALVLLLVSLAPAVTRWRKQAT